MTKELGKSISFKGTGKTGRHMKDIYLKGGEHDQPPSVDHPTLPLSGVNILSRARLGKNLVGLMYEKE